MNEPQTSFDNRKYWETRLREHYSLAGVGYLRLGRRYNEWMYRVRGAVFDRVVSELKGSNWTGIPVLDVGSGTGFYVERWRRTGAAVTGLDLTEVAVEELHRSFPEIPFVRADIGGTFEQIPLAAESFQAISAFDVLFHLVDDAEYARAFRNLAALLSPGGWLLWSDNFLRRGEARVLHQASRSLAVSQRLVEAAGFEILSRVPMFVLMNYPADSTRLVQRLWTVMVAPAVVAEPLGWLLGATLYPFERALLRLKRESPSTELMICRKR